METHCLIISFFLPSSILNLLGTILLSATVCGIGNSIKWQQDSVCVCVKNVGGYNQKRLEAPTTSTSHIQKSSGLMHSFVPVTGVELAPKSERQSVILKANADLD